mmetsp:Transcript_86929/g.156583  ORF Transcript_86929/g.156583 Transcript_86929/m.156583 type:complete len:114 (-) Transcript_86929:267-608(-)
MPLLVCLCVRRLKYADNHKTEINPPGQTNPVACAKEVCAKELGQRGRASSSVSSSPQQNPALSADNSTQGPPSCCIQKDRFLPLEQFHCCNIPISFNVPSSSDQSNDLNATWT